MKPFLVLLIVLLPATMTVNATGIRPKTKTAYSNLSIKCSNHRQAALHNDSAFVIIDKYDGSGAGIVKGFFYLDATHHIVIPGLKKGKYRVIIRFAGFHHQQFEQVIHITRKKTVTVNLHLGDWEEFSKENVYIPPQRVNAAKLLVTSMK